MKTHAGIQVHMLAVHSDTALKEWVEDKAMWKMLFTSISLLFFCLWDWRCGIW